MKITYIYHSGFLVETNLCYYIFDYFQGDLPQLDISKPVLVLSSHNHRDHYHPDIWNRLKEMDMEHVHGILSDDIDMQTVPANVNCLSVAPCREFELPLGQHLTTFRSTDQGVAFLIQEEKQLIYHAGDLNDWVWEGEEASYNEQMTRDYRRQMDSLAAKLNGRKLSCAFVVLDPRQEKDYDRGMLYFLNKVVADKVYPMHYWEKPQVISQFLSEHPQYKNRLMFTE